MKETVLPSYIEQVNYVDMQVKFAQEMAAIRNQTIRACARLNFYKEWSDPENIKERLEKFAAEAEESLKKSLELKRAIREAQGLPLEDPPLPEVLPQHMRGQAESTIRRMLAHEGWEFDRTAWKWREK